MSRFPRRRKIDPAAGRVPVVLFIHKRSWHLRRVLQGIRAYRPSRLFIFADGWAKGDSREKRACQTARRLVKQEVDWPCRCVLRCSSDKMGLKQSVEAGLRQVFRQAPEAIVLEDDCVASLKFFQFCEKHLHGYRMNPEVMSISGNCFADPAVSIPGGAYLSRYPHCWGWATWRRAWRKYRGRVPARDLQRILSRQKFPFREKLHWSRVISQLGRGQMSSWAYFWVWAHWQHGARVITPAVNLVTNIGFDATARHTRELAKPLLVRMGNGQEMAHGVVISAEKSEPLDRSVFQSHYQRMSGRRNWWVKMTDRLKALLNAQGQWVT